MRIFGFNITKSARSVPIGLTTFLGRIKESFAGAWQSNIELDSDRDLMRFSAVFACVDLIASDISKLGIRYVKRSARIWEEFGAPRFTEILKRPNQYQNRIQFIKAWITSKLLFGNVFVLVRRDVTLKVVAMYILDPRSVIPQVAEDGSVFYQAAADPLRGLGEQITIPASEIIHDRGICPWHPLVGVSPITACAVSGTMGGRIQANSLKLFSNMSRPGGVISAAGKIDDADAKRIKDYWDDNFSGGNAGKVAVLGDALKFDAMVMNSVDAQLIEQLKFSIEDVARCFHVPLHKIGADPSGSKAATNVAALEQSYYSDCLQSLIEELELCLDEGMEVPAGQGFEVDVDGLLRMDPAARYDAHTKAVSGGWMAPNEARAAENLPSVKGGDTPYLQQQNFALAALAARDKNPAPSSVAPKPAEPATEPPKEPANAD